MRKRYKETHARTRGSAAWREDVRQRCVERAKAERAQLQRSLRADEMAHIVAAEIDDFDCCCCCGEDEDEIASLAALEEELREELAAAEAAAYVASVEAAAEPFSARVLCPLCRAGLLCVERSAQLALCCGACGLRMPLQRESVGDGDFGGKAENVLRFVDAQLQRAMERHTLTPCPRDPSFAVESRFGPSTLVMTCDCGFFEIIV